MTLYQLKVWTTAAKHLNLTRAAKALNGAQPTVSNHIKCLEREFRLKLFQRAGRGIKLTREGKLFAKYAEKILLDVKRTEKKFKDRRGRKRR